MRPYRYVELSFIRRGTITLRMQYSKEVCVYMATDRLVGSLTSSLLQDNSSPHRTQDMQQHSVASVSAQQALRYILLQPNICYSVRYTQPRVIGYNTVLGFCVGRYQKIVAITKSLIMIKYTDHSNLEEYLEWTACYSNVHTLHSTPFCTHGKPPHSRRFPYLTNC